MSTRAANDNLREAKLDEFQMRWWTAWLPHLRENGSAYIWGNAPDLWRLWFVGGLSADRDLDRWEAFTGQKAVKVGEAVLA